MPARARGGARPTSSRASARRTSRTVDGGVGVRRRARARLRASTSSRASRAACCGASAAVRTATSASSTRSRARSTGRSSFRADRTIRVDVAATRSPLQSLEFATLTRQGRRLRPLSRRRSACVRRSTSARPTCASTPTSPTREATFYLDTSGEPLFKRGWRRDTEEAPLRENLAAGIARARRAGSRARRSSTRCAAAARSRSRRRSIAADRAPGLARTFGFQKLAWFDGPTWQRLKQRRATASSAAPPSPAMFASDRRAGRRREDARECRARRRSTRSSPSSRPTCSCAPRPRRRGVLVANPPYGDPPRRQGARRGDVPEARRRAEGALRRLDRVPVLRRPATCPKKIGLKAERRIPLWNGAIECRLYALPDRQRPARRVRWRLRRDTRPTDAMGMLPSRHYVSEHTKFIRDVLAKQARARRRPAEGPRDLVGQDAARAGRPAASMDEGRSRRRPYVYFGER